MGRARPLVAFILGVVGPNCTPSPRRADAQRDAQEPAPPRYWLANTPILDRPNGNERARITSRVLVEIWPDGRVRSMGHPESAIEGYLPADILEEPRANRGLMLYAQAVGDLHCDRPAGPVLGRLHPGAFVSVVPSDSEVVRIDSLPFSLPSDLKVYVERKVLGTERREPIPYRPAARVVSVRAPHVIGWILEGPTVSWTAVQCEDAWVHEDYRVSQYFQGIEVMGSSEHFDAGNLPWAISSQEGLRCPAHAASSVEHIPAGYEPIEIPDPDPLANVISKGGSIYWLRQTEKGPTCDQWQFTLNRPSGPRDAPSPIMDGRLVRREPYDGYDGKKQRASHGMFYRRAENGQPAALHLETLQLDGRQAFKCECEYAYSLLGAKGDELMLMGRSMPEHAVAYDPGDAERWFLSRKKCEAVRDDVARSIELDGTTATRLGLHAVVSSFGL